MPPFRPGNHSSDSSGANRLLATGNLAIAEATLDEPLFKLGSVFGETIVRYRYSNAFQVEPTTGASRLRISVEEAPLSLLWKLADLLTPPFFVLYILHTSRCDSQIGRYQSPAVQFEAVNDFMTEFCEFLTEDARHDLWLHSPASEATLVLDRHDLIFAYGPLEQFRAVLKGGYEEARVSGPLIPMPTCITRVMTKPNGESWVIFSGPVAPC
jgi:hypothetical protein